MAEQVGLTQLVGSWRLVSLVATYTDTKERIELYGPHPTGYMVLSPNGRIIFLFTRADRTPPQTDADRATLFSAMTAYTGRVRIEAEDRFVITVDLAWDPGWTGEQNSIFHPGGPPTENPDTSTDASANGQPTVRGRFGVGARDVTSIAGASVAKVVPYIGAVRSRHQVAATASLSRQHVRVFAGNDETLARSRSRRSKSAKARNRGR